MVKLAIETKSTTRSATCNAKNLNGFRRFPHCYRRVSHVIMFFVTHEEQFRQLMANEEERHDKQMAALRVIISLIDPNTGNIPQYIVDTLISQFPGKTPAALKSGATFFAEFPETVITLEDAIEYVMAEKPKAMIWTSRSVYQELIRYGWLFSQKPDAAVNTISALLIKMSERGDFRRIHQGRGRDPSRYVWMKEKDQEATEVTP